MTKILKFWTKTKIKCYSQKLKISGKKIGAFDPDLRVFGEFFSENCKEVIATCTLGYFTDLSTEYCFQVKLKHFEVKLGVFISTFGQFGKKKCQKKDLRDIRSRMGAI